jgi:hypothetical protein
MPEIASIKDLQLFVVGWDGDVELHSLTLLLSTGDGFICDMDDEEAYHKDAGDIPVIDVNYTLETEINSLNGITDKHAGAPAREWVNAFLLANRERFNLYHPTKTGG